MSLSAPIQFHAAGQSLQAILFHGVDMNASGLSKLEGQIRFVTDVELVALADILEVSVDYLLGREN